MSFMKFREKFLGVSWASAGVLVLFKALGVVVCALSHDKEVDQDAGDVKRRDDCEEHCPGHHVAYLFEDSARIEEQNFRGDEQHAKASQREHKAAALHALREEAEHKSDCGPRAKREKLPKSGEFNGGFAADQADKHCADHKPSEKITQGVARIFQKFFHRGYLA